MVNERRCDETCTATINTANQGPTEVVPCFFVWNVQLTRK